MIVILVGFMGAGKSSLLKRWAGEFSGSSYDLDELIADAAGVAPSSLGNWISENGFEKFRKIETQILEKSLKDGGPQILSLGGGAFHAKNRELITSFPLVQTVWIQVSAEECWRRVRDDANRPLVSQGEEAFKELYKERLVDYQQAKYKLSGEEEFPSWESFCKKYKISSIMD